MVQKATIAIVGGDKRELQFAEMLVRDGYAVRLSGFENYAPLPADNYANPLEALAGADAVVLPLAGTAETLIPKCPFSDIPPKLDKHFFSAVPEGTPVFIGWARKELKEVAGSVKLVEVVEDDELAILNSIPTAEGAIAIAMERTPITIHGSNALVVGFGRCAISLARMLNGIGAEVTVAARKPADLARALEMGFRICSTSELKKVAGTMAFIFNTVPALLINDEVLAAAGQCQLIVDIASGQGGTDFAAAAKRGIDAVLAPGLPGKAAPVTAGKILAKVYPRLFDQFGVNRR